MCDLHRTSTGIRPAALGHRKGIYSCIQRQVQWLSAGWPLKCHSTTQNIRETRHDAARDLVHVQQHGDRFTCLALNPSSCVSQKRYTSPGEPLEAELFGVFAGGEPNRS